MQWIVSYFSTAALLARISAVTFDLISQKAIDLIHFMDAYLTRLSLNALQCAGNWLEV